MKCGGTGVGAALGASAAVYGTVCVRNCTEAGVKQVCLIAQCPPAHHHLLVDQLVEGSDISFSRYPVVCVRKRTS